MELKKLKKGSWFTLKPIEEPKPNQVWIKGDYDRHSKKYDCYNWSDCNRLKEVAGNKEVFIDFIF